MPTRIRPLAFATLALLILPTLPALRAQELSSPVRLTLGPHGQTLVSDPRLEAVLVLEAASGEVVGSHPIRGKPLGVAFAGGQLVVGNSTEASLELYRQHKNGRWLPQGRLGSKGLVPDPTDLAADEPNSLLFALCGGARRVLVFTLGGELLGTLGGPEIGAGALVQPTAVAVDPAAREVYVSDYGDLRLGIFPAVRIYGYDGSFHGAISGETMQPGFAFSRPQGLAVDGAGHLFLVDALLGQVLVFDRASGLGLKTLGSYGPGPGQLLLPLDVAIDPASLDLQVTDNRNARVVVFPGGAVLP